jgi:hypothetical protein
MPLSVNPQAYGYMLMLVGAVTTTVVVFSAGVSVGLIVGRWSVG